MPRLALLLRYQGSAYHGWQRQPNLATIQQALEEALSAVAAESIVVFCAGRTDARVHAIGQVVHFDTQAIRPMRAWVLGTNRYLPPAIRVISAQVVPESFHARFSAESRSYRYYLYNHPINSAVFFEQASWHLHRLDEVAMQAAGKYLLGEHDFSAFQGAGCQAKHPVRTIESLTIERQGDWIVLSIRANAFLLHMVRNIVGTLLPIGRGEQAPAHLKAVLTSADRRLAGITAQPNGLYLTEVSYPTVFQIPKSPEGFHIFQSLL